jgi:hypothetical protein
MDSITLSITTQDLASMVTEVTSRTSRGVDRSAPAILGAVGSAILSGRRDIEIVYLVRQVWGELADEASVAVKELGPEAWHARLWRELADAAEDTHAALADIDPDSPEGTHLCGDPGAHIEFLRCGLAVPPELVEAWRHAVEDDRHPRAALELVTRG